MSKATPKSTHPLVGKTFLSYVPDTESEGSQMALSAPSVQPFKLKHQTENHP